MPGDDAVNSKQPRLPTYLHPDECHTAPSAAPALASCVLQNSAQRVEPPAAAVESSLESLLPWLCLKHGVCVFGGGMRWRSVACPLAAIADPGNTLVALPARRQGGAGQAAGGRSVQAPEEGPRGHARRRLLHMYRRVLQDIRRLQDAHNVRTLGCAVPCRAPSCRSEACASSSHVLEDTAADNE